MGRLEEKLIELGYKFAGKSYNTQSNNYRKEIGNYVIHIYLDYNKKIIKKYRTILYNVKNKDDIPFIEKFLNQLQHDLEVLEEC